jgi:hypothetical protein
LLDLYAANFEQLGSSDGPALYEVQGISMAEYLDNSTVAADIQLLVLEQHKAKKEMDRDVSYISYAKCFFVWLQLLSNVAFMALNAGGLFSAALRDLACLL